MKPLLTLWVFLAWCPLVAQVVINEIHYDPEPKHERVEFIELFNSGTTAVDLSGWQMDRGVTYAFPEGATLQAGAFLVLTEDVQAYNRKFGSIFTGGVKAFDQWQGSLSNQGETVRLTNAEGETVDTVVYSVGFPWPVAPNDGTGRSMELIHPALENDLGSSWRPAEGKPTPGEVNSVYSESVPPNIRQVRQQPEAPTVGQEVTISAKVSDPDGVARVQLFYQCVEPGDYVRLEDPRYESDWQSVEMTQEDQSAIYSVILPAELQQHRRLIRYRIEIEDGLGLAVRVPFADDPTPNFAYFCYGEVPAWTGAAIPGETDSVVFGADVLHSLPIYHLISREEDVLACQYNNAFNNKVYRFLGTLVVDGKVYDHMRYRIRGHGSTYNTGKNKWKWRFNRGNLFQGRDNFGRKYKEPVRTLNISAMASPWNPANRGMAGLDEALAFRMWQMVGVPAVNTNYLHLRVIDDTTEADANDQYEGDLWGLYLAIEQFDGRALRARDLPDGNVYNMHFGNSNLLNEGPGQVTDGSDLKTFVSRSGYNKTNPIQPVEWWREHVNLDWYYSYRAVWEAVNHSDQRDQENSHYYHNPETGQWSIHPWDVDLLYEEFDRWGPDAVQSTTPFEQFRKCLEHPELQLEFQNRVRELQDLFLNDDQLWHLIDEFAGVVGSKVAEGNAFPITQFERSGSRVHVTTAEPHGFTVGSTVYVAGTQPFSYSGAKQVLEVPSPNQLVYAGSLFAPSPEPPTLQTTVSAEPAGGGWWEIDRARWDRHPRSKAVEGPSTNTGSFYVNPFRYTRFSGKVRTLDSADFPGMVQWVKDFTVPPGFGGQQLADLSEEKASIPQTPEITYTGAEGYDLSALRFTSSAFVPVASIFTPQSFAAMQWRAAEISNPSTPDYVAGEPMVFEINSVWESDRITVFTPEIQLPADVLRPGKTYRVRVRHLTDTNVWSHWSKPIEFQPTADLSSYKGLVISEIMYHPQEATAVEQAAGYEESDFEYIELENRGDHSIDLTPLRFTKGIDFDLRNLETTRLEVGQRLLLVRNGAAFAARYGQTIPVAGEWGMDRLSNGGERLKLSLGAGIGVIDITYADTAPWPELADGGGRSLTLIGEQWLAHAPTPGSSMGFVATLELLSHNIDIESAVLSLTWRTRIDAVYQLERSRDLVMWELVGDPVKATSDQATHAHPLAVDEDLTAYYRIRELP